MRTFLATITLFFLIACDDGHRESIADDGGSNDSGTLTDANKPMDSSVDSGSDLSTGLSANFGDNTFSFTRAFYGLSVGSEGNEFYIEAYSGGSDECPHMNSPQPRHSLILTGLAVGHAETVNTGLSANYIDFTGTILTDKPSAAATQVGIKNATSNPCVACVGMPAMIDSGSIQFDLMTTFERGSVSGRLHATHCDSMDLEQ